MRLKKAKKIPYYFLLAFLTIGMSLTLGFLSYGGMFVLAPFVAAAVGSLVLFIAYEWEVYKENIKSTLQKLFQPRYLERQLAKQFLLTALSLADKDTASRPQFFIDYDEQLAAAHETGHHGSKKMQAAAEKRLRYLEDWWARRVFRLKSQSLEEALKQVQTEYEREALTWLSTHMDEYQAIEAKRNTHRILFHVVKAFSLIAGAFMALGTSYLVMETVASVPAFASLTFLTSPFLVVPMALIAGAAYACLTYNAVTDMISNDTLRKWYYKFRREITNPEGIQGKTIVKIIIAGLLVALAVALTICTAGTWWTVAKNARPVFQWLEKMPTFVMGIINPIITGTSTIIFNLQNTSESLEQIEEGIDELEKGNPFKRAGAHVSESFANLRKRESWWQIFNPGRLILKITVTPFRLILFLGHLISMGVTSDRIPGIPSVLSAMLGIISEGFEDFHYFFDAGHHHKHGELTAAKLREEHLGEHSHHSHGYDLPTIVIMFIFSPIYLLATVWEVVASRNRRPLSFQQALKKHLGMREDMPDGDLPALSSSGKIALAIDKIDEYQEENANTTIQPEVARQKMAALQEVRADLVAADRQPTPVDKVFHEAIAKRKQIFDHHRVGFFRDKTTETRHFVDGLTDALGLQDTAGAAAA